MPLVTDANGVASWVDEADLEAVLRAAAGNTADTVAASGNPPAAAYGSISPQVVVTADGPGDLTFALQPLTLTQWCNMGFDADVANALSCRRPSRTRRLGSGFPPHLQGCDVQPWTVGWLCNGLSNSIAAVYVAAVYFAAVSVGAV